MNVITMSILGAVLGALILMFFISLFTAEKIDLAGRIDREQVAEMADGGVPWRFPIPGMVACIKTCSG